MFSSGYQVYVLNTSDAVLMQLYMSVAACDGLSQYDTAFFSLLLRHPQLRSICYGLSRVKTRGQ